jgi:multiple sugar transport system permease protein
VNNHADRRFSFLIILPAAVFLTCFVLYPIGLLVYQSFFKINFLDSSQSVFVGLDQYLKVFTSTRVFDSSLRTLAYTGLAVTLEFCIGFGVALLLNSLARRATVIRTMFLFPLMVPPIVAGLLWRFMLIGNFGIVNATLAQWGIISSPEAIQWLSDPQMALYSVVLADAWVTTSFVTLILYTGMQNLSKEVMEAARIDGASSVQMFLKITLPLLRPVIAVVLVLRGMDAARTFDLVWIMTGGGPSFGSEVLSLNIYQQMVVYHNVGQASATAVVFMAALLLFSFFVVFPIWSPIRRRS